MNGYSGFYQQGNTSLPDNHRRSLLLEMSALQCHVHGQNVFPLIRDSFCAASVSKKEHAPFSLKRSDRACHLVLDGDIFNTEELSSLLSARGYSFQGNIYELVLYGFMELGMEFIRKINGNFSIVIFDERHEILYLFRDHFGTKPLFYTTKDGVTAFSSEIKSLLLFRNEKPSLSKEGLNEIFSIGPARTPGKATFDHIYEVCPACCVSVNKYGLCQTTYWSLACQAHPHSDYEETVLYTKELLDNAMKQQLQIDSAPCSLLSGGVDSSLISAYLKADCNNKGKKPITISFDFTQNEKYFKASSFQPSQDRPYIDAMIKHLDCEHHFLECDYETLAANLGNSVRAHDLPCMADIDSSLLYFSKEVCKIAEVAYTGECADEVFGGYPWLHSGDEPLEDNFPWAPSLSPRTQVMSPELIEYLNPEDYTKNTYHKAIRSICVLPDESRQDAMRRKYTHLNLYWFMQTLLNRMDRCGRVSGLTARIPFADKNLVQYVYNAPWTMKARNGLVKSLLRQTGEHMLPQQILLRKKSPFPKTYHPAYEKLLSGMLIEEIRDSQAPILKLIDKAHVLTLIESPKDYGSPWYGQLMASPQMIAYLWQINFWLKEYQVQIQL